MHCSKCKTVITKGVMIADTSNTMLVGEEERVEVPVCYCKECFKQEFMGE